MQKYLLWQRSSFPILSQMCLKTDNKTGGLILFQQKSPETPENRQLIALEHIRTSLIDSDNVQCSCMKYNKVINDPTSVETLDWSL